MKYEVELGTRFKQAFKRLSKKYHSLDKDLEVFLDELEKNPTMGSDLGHGVRKVRMAISDKGKGMPSLRLSSTFLLFRVSAISFASSILQ